MKKSLLWTLSGLAILAIAALAWRMTAQRSPATPVVTAASPAVLELGAQEVWLARTESFSIGLPVSGTLKARQSAMVKVRVAGELLDLGVREGDAVQAGQVLARIDPAEYQARWRQASQQADSARAQMDIAQKQYDNNAALVQQGFISQTALQTSLLNLQAARSAWQAAAAAAEVTRKALDDTMLRAPIGGLVSQRLAQPGERLAVDARVVEIVNLGAFEMEAALPPQDARTVRVGQTAQLQVEGIEQVVPARVLRINPSTQAGSRSVLVYMEVAGREGLRHGAFAQGTLGSRTEEGIAVPLGSVRTDKPLPYVQVIEDGRVRHVTVQPGPRIQAGLQTRVLVTGLNEGTQVLTPGVGALREGVQVRAASAAAR